ncbi:hypothetical protein HanRHA438_Chr16g0751491 [Helianthus annuus]|nr:hypothetical protein HanLR1_Chr16g0613811 [Helianthus annuus]KAJ0644246.1 hypothetical protein HanOQP8_Chr16g0609841 [Helianthus annuus]KAJ0835120.1 hypothetical protein HanRHA438_Chr16g0751491 [Helianthus annuus]
MVLRNNVNNLKAEIEKLKKEKAEAETARDEARSHRERSEQREVQTCANLALRNKEIEELTSLLTDQEQTKVEFESAKKDLQLERVEKAEAARRLVETEEKLESSETTRVTTESLVEPLKNDMLWMQHHGIINVANSVLNFIDLDQTVAHLMVTPVTTVMRKVMRSALSMLPVLRRLTGAPTGLLPAGLTLVLIMLQLKQSIITCAFQCGSGDHCVAV